MTSDYSLFCGIQIETMYLMQIQPFFHSFQNIIILFIRGWFMKNWTSCGAF